MALRLSSGGTSNGAKCQKTSQSWNADLVKPISTCARPTNWDPAELTEEGLDGGWYVDVGSGKRIE